MPPRGKHTTAARVIDALCWGAIISIPLWMVPATRGIGALLKAAGWI